MQIVKQWLSKFKKYFFSFHDGYFVVPYLANTPETMMESLKGVPFVQLFHEMNYYSTKNVFFEGVCHIDEIETGLWLVFSEINLKKNLCFKLYYDDDTANDYYCLSLSIVESSHAVQSTTTDAKIKHSSSFWLFSKPGATSSSYHLNGTKTAVLMVYFKEEWFKKNIQENTHFETIALKEFFRSEEDFLYVPVSLYAEKDLYQPIVDVILNKGSRGIENPLMLKIQVLQLIDRFGEKLHHLSANRMRKDEVSDRDMGVLLKVEQLLQEAIFAEFPTISFLSRQAGFSETKLKTIFKKRYGKTLYQYYGEYQIQQAKRMLEESDRSVKHVAYTFNYTSPSKFSSAFKKVTGVLPSEIKQA